MTLEDRVARLEQQVARLLQRLDASAEAEGPGSSDAGKAHPLDSAPAAAADSGPRRSSGSRQWSWQADHGASEAGTGARSPADPPASLADHGERWLGRVGVAFVVLAFGFLFKYAFDQGWIGPAFRLALGLLAATAMLVVGLRLEGSRERYSQYLLGGAIAVYYLVGFASYELYTLVPFAIAFAFMCAVTVLAFVLAERQRLPSLAVIGASGGLSTPFLVNAGSGNVPGLVAYTTVLLAGAGALQFLRGWRSLLIVLGFGGLAVMGLAVGLASRGALTIEAVITTLGILSVVALFGVFPLYRAHWRRFDPATWQEPPLPPSMSGVATPAGVAVWMLRLGSFAAACIGTLELAALFDLDRTSVGALYGLAFVAYATLASGLRGTRSAFEVAAETASIMIVLAIVLVLFDYRMLLPLAVSGAAMHSVHARWTAPGVAVIAHVLFAQLALLVVSRVQTVGVGAATPFAPEELGALGAIVLAFTTTFVLTSPSAKQIYRGAAHVAFMIWLATQFGPMERGQELTSLSWGIYGIVLLLVSLRLQDRGVQLAGLATLGIVAAKLLLVDMAQVDVIWRILLFMGFGGAFLGLSYLINRNGGD
jgi:uncharacterized membrane protein